jgi:hypothetical protein
MRPAKASWLGATLAAVLACALGCKKNPQVSFEVLLPPGVSDQAQWLEIGVLPGACPAPAQLGGGLPEIGTLVRVAFEKGNTSPPAVGDLPRGAYAFAAVARGADCAVLATGCTHVDVSTARDVTITLAATAAPSAACAAGEQCVDARCVPVLDNGNPAVGARCTMDLVGAGPFADPFAISSDVVAGPALAATESGFLLAYREYDPLNGQAQLTTGAIDPGGGLVLSAPTTLSGQCPNQDESDGVGLAYAGGVGLVASVRPACAQSGAGVDLVQLDAAGKVKTSSFAGGLGQHPALAGAHALALTSASAGILAYVDQNRASFVTLAGLAAGSPVQFGGAPPQSLAQVTADSGLVGLLSSVGPMALELRVAATPSPLATPITVPGAWGAVTAEGLRAFVLSGSDAMAGPVAWASVDLGASSPAASSTFSPLGAGPATGGDAVFQADHAFFAVEQPGIVSVVVYDHASTSPTVLRGIRVSDDPRVPSQAGVRDGRVAVAATSSRVAVAWATGKTLGPNDTVGGYAVFACTP